MTKFNKFMPNIHYLFRPIFISSFTLAGLFLCDSGPIGPFWRFPKTDIFLLYCSTYLYVRVFFSCDLPNLSNKN